MLAEVGTTSEIVDSLILPIWKDAPLGRYRPAEAKKLCQRRADWLGSGLFVVNEGWRGIHLKTVIVAVGSFLEINAGKQQLEPTRQPQTSRSHRWG